MIATSFSMNCQEEVLHVVTQKGHYYLSLNGPFSKLYNLKVKSARDLGFNLNPSKIRPCVQPSIAIFYGNPGTPSSP